MSESKRLMMNKKLVIDGHAHACGEYLTAEKIKQKLNNTKVDMVLLTAGQYGSKITYGLKDLARGNPYGDVVSKNNRMTSIIISLMRTIKSISKGNEYVYELKCQLPGIVKQCYWVTKRNWKDTAKDYERMSFDAIKFHQCWEKFNFADEFFVKTVEWAAQRELPIFIHVRTLAQVKELIAFIKEHSKAIIIIGHLYGMELFMEEEKRYFENVYFDLSNCYFVSKERTMMAYKHFGPEHLLMGSDTPYGKKSLENTVFQISDLPIPIEGKEGILGLNLAKLLKLKI